jgi:hypothetical protein
MILLRSLDRQDATYDILAMIWPGSHRYFVMYKVFLVHGHDSGSEGSSKVYIS